ncbi:uncharacterized protein LOC135374431 [Ornithodoros turicata]|uniref:uncharacterized protein LOC135374431 n=1 Tax=Ornithodoros turicata TaxID=34597 RepID=UPI0031391FF0
MESQPTPPNIPPGQDVPLHGDRAHQPVLHGLTVKIPGFGRLTQSSALGPNEAAEVRDIVTVPPTERPYDALKTALTRRTTASEQERLRQLLTAEVLGDRRPSQLLRRMQQLLGDRAAAVDESILRELFLQRLPNTVRMILTTSSTVSLDALAEMADKIMDIAPPDISVVPSSSAPVTPTLADFQALRDEVARLTTMISTSLHLSHRPRSPRPRSPRRAGHRRSPLRPHSADSTDCWYHQNFGDNAHHCQPPCSHSGNGSVSN